MIWLVAAQPDEIGLQSKKHLKICTEKIKWRTWLKIHRLVLTVEHKFMVLREFGRTTPQIHNHDMYDKWRETRLKVRMTKCCCKMVEAIVYNSKNRNANQRPSEKTTGEGETQLSSHAPPWLRTAQKVRQIETETEGMKQTSALQLYDWNMELLQLRVVERRSACCVLVWLRDKRQEILPNLQMSIDKQQNMDTSPRQRMKDRNRALGAPGRV